MDMHKKVYRAIRLDADLDAAIPLLLERLKTPKGHKQTFSNFCREAIRNAYNLKVREYNERMAPATPEA